MSNDKNSKEIEIKRSENSDSDSYLKSEDEIRNANEADSYLKLQKELEELKDKYLRTSAEFDNYRKRMDKNMQDMIDATKRSAIGDFLIVLDNMEKAINVSKEHKETIIEGVELTVKSFKDLLKKHNIETIDPGEETFNPDIHEALAMHDSENVPKNSIIQTLEKGYIYKNKLIKPAKVIVSKGKKEKKNIDEEDI